MIRNVRLKKVLKSTVFRIISLVNKIIPKKNNYIMLYSGNKGIDFNLLPLKKYLIENRYNVNNKIICGIESMKYSVNDSCKYVNHFKSIFYFLHTKHVFYTAGQLPIKPSKDQIVIHLQHGTTFKTCGLLTKINNGDEMFFSKCVATSDIYKKIYSRAFNCKVDDVIINSEPVTDIFFNNKYKKYNLGEFSKVILWVPTFRQSDYLGYNDSDSEELLPLFCENDYEELNEFLKKLNFKLIVKIHPSQELTKYNKLRFSNLDILSSNDFKDSGMELYNLLPQIDLLLADYSSVFLQFLLIGKPIAFVVPDIEEYMRKRGTVFNNYDEIMAGEIIKNKKDFYKFFMDFSNGIDNYEILRKKAKEIIHKFDDGHSCERLIEYSRIKLEGGCDEK